MHVQGREHGNGRGRKSLAVYVDPTRATCALSLPAARRTVAEVAELVGRSISTIEASLTRATRALDARDVDNTTPIQALAQLRALDEVVARLRFGLADDASSYRPRSAAEGPA